MPQDSSRILVNATGTDRIRLWYLHGGKLEYEFHDNTTWIFVTGSGYDLDFLEAQLETVPYISIARDRMADIFGTKNGIRIDLKPSRIRDMVFAINRIGSGRKFQIYNSDINPILRYAALNGLKFFDLANSLDIEPDIVSVKIIPVLDRGNVRAFWIDDKYYSSVDGRSLSALRDSLWQSLVIVYGNEFNSFLSLLSSAERMGFDIPRYRKTKGGSYESYGRIMYKSDSLQMSGRICIPAESFIYSESGLHGIYQISRISLLPPEISAIVTPGTAVSSLEVSHALSKGILVPLYKNDHESEKTLDELFTMDRGGLALQPEPGIYEDVYEIDFSSMYPSIIVRYNLSPETISRKQGFEVPDSPYFIEYEKRGFLSEALEFLLDTRLFYKSVKTKSDVYAKRDAALKWLLLTSFGYTGYKNAKFGRIEVHEAITSLGRWSLTQAIDIAHSNGFEVIHGIVDSLWLKGKGSIKKVLEEIKEKTRIDIVLEGHYRWIVFFPAENGIGAVNRYVGLKYDQTYKFRGIELRRTDIPMLCKKFQAEGLEILRSCGSPDEIGEKKGEVENLKKRYLATIGTTGPEDLRINVVASKRLPDYRVNGIQKKTLEEYAKHGVELQPGQSTSVIVTSWRGRSLSLNPEEDEFDRKYYTKLLLRSFRIFDFIFSKVSTKKRPSLYDPVFSQSSPQEH